MKHYQTIFLFLIIIIAIFFRFWQLNEIPPGLYPDVAINGMDAIKANETGNYKMFYPDNNGREGLFINLIAIFFKIFGASVLSMKLLAATIGLLAVFGMYLLAKELFNPQIALLSSYFMAISFWHINFSRIGFRAIMVPFFLVFTFYFLYHGIKTKKIINFILAGALLGLGFHTYISFRLAPLILIIPLIEIILHCKQAPQQTKKFIFLSFIFLLFTFITALPLILYFINSPADFLGRTSQVSVFAAQNPIKELTISAIKTLGMFNIIGDYNWRHNLAGAPMLFWPIGVLFILGAIISIKKIVKQLTNQKNCQLSHYTGHLLAIIWFVVMLLPAILTTEGLPHALRSIGAIPPVFLLAGIGAYFAYYKILSPLFTKNKIEKILLPLCFIFFIFVANAEYKKYFTDWGKNQITRDAFAQNYVDIGDYLLTLPSNIDKYVIINQGGVLVNDLPMPSQTIMFITQSKEPDIKIKYLLENQMDEVKIQNSPEAVIIPLSYNEEIFKKLKEKFPLGEVSKINDFGAFKIFSVR